MKEWQTYVFDVNGFEMEAVYHKETVENVFLPLLRHLTDLQKKKASRIVVFLAAPPAVGKSTLCQLLEYLSRQDKTITEVQTLGLDGFHYPSEYIHSHDAIVMGKQVPMSSVKGCPETYDAEKFRKKLNAIKKQTIFWPVYDRNIHDVMEDVIEVTKNIVIIEGNWLLLDEEPWKSMKNEADYTILIRSEEKLLKERLIARKMKGGFSRKNAEEWYQNSDSVNVQRVLRSSMPGDLILKMEKDGDYINE